MNKSSPSPPLKKCGNAATFTAGNRERKPDKDRNPYPKRKQCYITVSKTVKTNNNLTELTLKKLVLPCAGAGVPVGGGDHRVGVLWVDFKA